MTLTFTCQFTVYDRSAYHVWRL